MALFNRLTPQQQQAFDRLRAPEWAPLVDLLTATLVEAQDHLLVAETPVGVHRLQGKITVLKGILGAISAH